MIRQSALALVVATVARAYASSVEPFVHLLIDREKTFYDLQSGNQLWFARMTVWAVMPAQVVTPGDNGVFGFRDPVAGTEQLVMSFRLCRTAKLDLASAWKSHRSVSHSTMSARATSQKTGRKPPRIGFSWETNLPKFQLVPLNVTNSGALQPLSDR